MKTRHRWLWITAAAVLIAALVAGARAATITGTDVEVSEDALSEVTIDSNPTNGNNLVIVGHDDLAASFENMNTFFTTDGGATWTAEPIGDAGDGIASNFRFDPAVIYDDSGNVYVAYGARDGATPPNTTVVVARSTDGGDTYGTFRQLATNAQPVPSTPPGNDRWTFASGPGPGGTGQRVYLAWTQNVREGSPSVLDQRIVVSSTADAGVTWSAPVVVNDGSVAGADAGNLTAVPAVGPDGDLYLAWHDIGGNRIMFDRSTDGGVTWGTDIQLTTTGVGFLVSIPAQNDRGVGPFGVLAADRSGGPNDDRIYAAYLEAGAGGMPDTNVLVRFSDDDGANWSAPVTVNDDGGTTSQFLPWLDVDQETGLVAAVWYDARDDAQNRMVHVYSSVSHNGGATWDANVRVTDNPSDMSANNPSGASPLSYAGDFLEYIGVAAQDCRLVPVWADNSETRTVDPDDFDYYVDRLTITGGLCNTPPTVSAGGPYNTVEGTPVDVTATGNDPDGDTLTYSWDLDDNGSFETVGKTVSYDLVGRDGVYTIRVQADDGNGGVATASTTVTVANVAPTVSLTSDAPKDENTAVTVSGSIEDVGWLDPLTATIDWGPGPPEAISGTLTNLKPKAKLAFSVSHVYGDDGSFEAEVCGTDDDAATTCKTIALKIDNVAPTASIDESGTVTLNGGQAIVTNAGATVPFGAKATDPGSDDLTFTWDWDDGSPNTVTRYLNDVLIDPDPDPSPTIHSRDVTDEPEHTFGAACLYDVGLTVADDDNGSVTDAVTVIVAGNAASNRTAGYWFNQYKLGSAQQIPTATLDCYLDIVEFVSGVFSEARAAGTIGQAEGVLKATAKDALDALDRQLLAAWLNFANGATGLTELVDTNGDKVADTPFLTMMANAEAVRLSPTSTRAAILAQYAILERFNNTP